MGRYFEKEANLKFALATTNCNNFHSYTGWHFSLSGHFGELQGRSDIHIDLLATFQADRTVQTGQAGARIGDEIPSPGPENY